MRSIAWSSRAARNAARVWVRIPSQAKLSASRTSWMSPASRVSSSSNKIRKGVFAFVSSRWLLQAARRRLVDDRPEHAEFLDRVDELMKVDGLYDVGVHPEYQAGCRVQSLRARRRSRRSTSLLAEAAGSSRAGEAADDPRCRFASRCAHAEFHPCRCRAAGDRRRARLTAR